MKENAGHEIGKALKSIMKRVNRINEGEKAMDKYKLVMPENRGEKTFKVTIKADSNDADYITEISEYTQEEFEGEVVDALIDLQKNYGERHELEDYGSKWDDYDDAFDEDGNLIEGKVNYEDVLEIPYSDWGRCHSLESVEVICIDKNGVTWNVELAGVDYE